MKLCKISAGAFQQELLLSQSPRSCIPTNRPVMGEVLLGRSPGWWAATLATYCPSRMVEHPKYMSTKPCARPPGSRCISVKERKVDLGLVVGIFSCLMYFRWGRKENKCLYYLGLAHTIWGIIKVSLIKSLLKTVTFHMHKFHIKLPADNSVSGRASERGRRATRSRYSASR